MSRTIFKGVPGSLLVLIAAVFFISGCKFGHPKYTVTVKLQDNIKGDPPAGDHKYKELDEIIFGYEYTDGRKEIPPMYMNESSRKVPTDITGRGKFVVYTDTIMYVGEPDIRTKWDMVFTSKSGDPSYWDLVFEGADHKSGTFTISNGKNGTWSYDDDDQLIMVFENWEGYKFTGYAGPRYISGEWKGPSEEAGEWKAVFID